MNHKQHHGHGSQLDLSSNGEASRELEQPLEERIEDLRHRLRIEAAVVEGAKNAIKLLERGNRDKSDKKALQEVRISSIGSCLYFHEIRKGNSLVFCFPGYISTY